MIGEKVSIIIPMYNAEKSVKRCLESVLKQTYTNIEVLCINDGSNDQTTAIVNSICKTDSRVLLINKKNGGVSSARNLGIEKATGYYIQFLDVDDALEQHSTETMVKELASKNLDIIMCGYHNVSRSIEVSLQRRVLNLDEIVDDFVSIYLSTYLNPPWNKLYIRKNIKTQFPIEMNLGEDLVFNLNYLKECKKIGIIPDMIYIYTVGQPESLTSKYHNNAVECVENKIKCILDFISPDMQENMPIALADSFWKDYKHCIDGMIISGYFETEQLKTYFTELRTKEIWNKCFSAYIPEERISLEFWNKSYDKYIVSIKKKSTIQSVKRSIKNIISRIRKNQ